MMKNNYNKVKCAKPELLAPVGGWKHLKAAVNNGADAVYMGGSAFNARIFAENFTQEDLPEAIDYAHAHNVKVYITFNTLIKDSELRKALEHANYLYEIGADALIVQDMGLARLVHKYLPDFPLHLSTQGTVYNEEAVELVKEIGFSRIVPARELSLEEIRRLVIKCKEVSIGDSRALEADEIDVEVFVHGALCMCYSGQCQMSRGLSTKGNSRSGNRGTCAQPCRHAYTDDQGERSYALSPKDICMIESIPDLVEVGAASFKIEGRIKTPEYVAIVTRLYRKYIDKYFGLLASNNFDHSIAKQAYTVKPQDILYLKQAFNRGGFTSGYLYGNPEEKLLSGTSPKNQGLYLGQLIALIDNENKVEDRDEKAAVRGALRRGRVLACINVKQGELHMGDGIEFRSSSVDFDSNPIGNITTYVKNIGNNLYLVGDFEEQQGSNVHGASSNRNTSTTSSNITRLAIGDQVYKVTDKALQEAALNYAEHKLPATFSLTARIGQYLSLVMTDVKSGFSYEVVGDHMVEQALKTATDKDRIISQLCRLGDTAFTADQNSCDVELDDNAMVPVSLINRMRREATDALYEHRINSIKKLRTPLSRAQLDVISAKELLGSDKLEFDSFTDCYSTASFKPIPLETFMLDTEEQLESARKSGRKLLPYILNISKGKLDEYIVENWDSIIEALQTGNCGILIGNLSWIKQFQDAGIKVYADYGLNIYNKQAAKLFEELGLEIYAPSHESGICDSRGLPLMITEHPINSSTLTDRKGASHRVEQAPSGDKYLIY